MIDRDLGARVREVVGWYPIVTITGPRQSGKTTLCRALFPDKPYLSLEPLDARDALRADPRGYLASVGEQGAVIDEFQEVPDLASYLQEEVDERPAPGRFVLTGSQHFGLNEAVSQSLAGRTSVLTLLPPSMQELWRFPEGRRPLMETLVAGSYPAIHDRGVPAATWLADYVTTYVQRDVRQVLRVGDLERFTRFLRLCAGRTGQVLNLSALGADAGVSHNTARSWLSVLETSYVLFRLPPWFRNVKKQLIKTPKLHFFDSGLVCHLLGIRTADQLRTHPLRGAVFESAVVAEVYKQRVHAGLSPDLFYVRDRKGLEIDLLIDTPERVELVEIKSGMTVASDWFRPLDRVASLIEATDEHRPARRTLVYGGDRAGVRALARVLPWSELPTLSL